MDERVPWVPSARERMGVEEAKRMEARGGSAAFQGGGTEEGLGMRAEGSGMDAWAQARAVARAARGGTPVVMRASFQSARVLPRPLRSDPYQMSRRFEESSNAPLMWYGR